jgi:hypothetical protein
MKHNQLKTKKKSDLKGTDIVLIVIGLFDVFFTLVMCQFFYLYQSVPDSLIVAIFGATFGECGFCTYIYKKRKENEMKRTTFGEVTGFDDAEVIDDGIHGGIVPGEDQTHGDPRYAEHEDLGIADSSSGIH